MQNKRYRLLKWYPSLSTSWEVGMEVGQGDRQGCCANFSPCDAKYPQWQISYDQVVNYPEFWEEIVEKDYEILEYRLLPYTGGECKNVTTSSGEFKIVKIRRKSDGVEFKIGDRVKATDNYYWNGVEFIERNSGWWNRCYYNTTIKEFKVIPEGVLIIYNSEKATHGQLIQHVEKIKEPILITEDGYECTLDDRVFGVLPKGSWETRFGINAESGILVHNLYDTGGKRYSEYSPWLWFKTKENAEKYIYENKPEFSRKQILDAIEYAKYAEFSKGIWVLALKIKEKIKVIN